MPIIYFLNVKHGDCSLITHSSRNVTVIDVCNAKPEETLLEKRLAKAFASLEKGPGNLNQKEHPTNPIAHMKEHGIASVFRFIATHPDMDHLDGIKIFFETFSPANFWDTANNADKDFEAEAQFDEDDCLFYKNLRDTDPQEDPKRLVLYSGSQGQFYNKGTDGAAGGDGLHILAPTKELVTAANDSEDYNDCSYVILYRTGGHKIVFGGDSHDATWEHILEKHPDVKDIDVLIAPHHGRASDRSYEFLDVLNPKLTLFGNARSEHLAYDAWNNRKLPPLLRTIRLGT